MTNRFQFDAESVLVFFGPEEIHVSNWDQPLSEPQQPPRIHASQIPYDAFRPVYFAPEDIHIGNWFQELAVPLPPQRIEVRNIPFELAPGIYFGGELITVDKWDNPLERPGVPRKVQVSTLPFSWLTEFHTPTHPVPDVATWYQELTQPFPKPFLPVSAVPFAGYLRLPNVFGCIEAEITDYFIARARPVIQMPILYITQWFLYSAAPPPCATTYQSPGTQPPHSGD